MNLAGEAVGRQPFRHGIAVEERSVDPFGWGTKDSVKLNGILGHDAFLLGRCGHRAWQAAGFYDGDEQGDTGSTGPGRFLEKARISAAPSFRGRRYRGGGGGAGHRRACT
jgi:hypothetical protein